jgi:hypothetical protein
MPRDYRYKDLQTLLTAINNDVDVPPVDIDPKLLSRRVWVGSVFHLKAEEPPPEVLFAEKRSEVAKWLRAKGARGLGRHGPARDCRGGREYELKELSVLAILWLPPDDDL